MPEIDGDNRKSLNSFFFEKTIQRPYLFKVSFPTELSSYYASNGGIGNASYNAFKDYTNNFIDGAEQYTSPAAFQIKEYWVKSVNLPNFSFTKALTKIGPWSTSIPVTDFDGYELTIDFEETENGDIARMCDWFRSRQLTSDGIFWPPALSTYPWISVDVFKQNDQQVASYRFKEIHFLTASEPQFSYADNSPISYNVTFNANTMESSYYDSIIYK